MKAVVIREHGGLEQLRIEDRPPPEPAPGQALIEVRAVALNHLDIWARKGVPGHKFPLPLVPGCDIAGVVKDIGPGAEHLDIGAEVVICPGVSCGHCPACLHGRDHHCREYGILGETRDGGCAEAVVVPAVNVRPKPARLSFEEAAALPLTFLTAWCMLVGRALVRPGEVVLIQAAGSGVSSAGIQIAKLWGAEVIAVAGSEAKLAQAAKLGADHTINHRDADVAKRVKEITSGRGAAIALDHVGSATFATTMKSLAWQGRLVTCGATSGPMVELNLTHVFFKSLSLLGSTMGSKGDLCEVLDHVEAGRLRPVVDRVLPLDQVADAHRALESRDVFGKVVLTP